MLRRLHIENFKSIDRLDFEPGRFNVLIGENGSGKSDVLEALAFAGAAADCDKLDRTFLKRLGFLPGDKESPGPASAPQKRPVRLTFEGESGEYGMRFTDENGVACKFWDQSTHKKSAELEAAFARIGQVCDEHPNEIIRRVVELAGAELQALRSRRKAESLASYVAYSPEASALRAFEREGQILPPGVAGEGLFKLLQALAADEKDPSRFAELKESLRLLDWFESIEVPALRGAMRASSAWLRDRFVPEAMSYFDQPSANHAFLFVLFYLALFVSSDTPRLFGIDNLDASLNPKLCRELTRRLAGLAKKYDKQVVVMTHNPAVLDGIDLNDDEQRLFVVRRGRKGDTKLRRVSAPQPVAGEPPINLSEAFLRGLLGGLPQSF